MKLSLLAALGVACLVGYFLGWHEGHFPGLSATSIAAILGLSLLHYLAEPSRWWVYLGENTAKRWSIFYHVFSCTAFLNFVLPAKLGLPLRYWLMTRQAGLPAATVASYMAIDGALSLLLWTLASLVLGGGTLAWMLEQDARLAQIPPWFAAVVITALILAGVLWAVLHRRWPGWRQSLKRELPRLSPHKISLAAAILLLDIGSYVARHAAILAALSAPSIGLPAIATATVLSIYAGFLCMLPMGLIGYDAVMVLLLNQFGIPLQTALMVPLVNRSASLLLCALLGIPSSFKLGLGVRGRAISAAMDKGDHER